MPTVLSCDNCGEPIEGNGWRCYPAVVEGGQLVGTTGEGENAIVVGLPSDLCDECFPLDHPMKADDAVGD